MTAADVIRMLLEMDQQMVAPRPSHMGIAAEIVATLAEHAEPSLRRPDLIGDVGAIDLSGVRKRVRRPSDLAQPTMDLATENDRLRVELEEASKTIDWWEKKSAHGCIDAPCRVCDPGLYEGRG